LVQEGLEDNGRCHLIDALPSLPASHPRGQQGSFSYSRREALIDECHLEMSSFLNLPGESAGRIGRGPFLTAQRCWQANDDLGDLQLEGEGGDPIEGQVTGHNFKRMCGQTQQIRHGQADPLGAVIDP
jgi:hypothetical protein